jgi:biopolymer transport protein ExbD
MKIKKVRTVDAYIPTASMADIAFLLIVFFMVTAVFQVDKTALTLPKSIIRSEVVKGSAFIVITADNYIKVTDGKKDSYPIDLTDVLSFTVDITSKDPNQPIVIKADASVKWDIIDKVLEQVQQARAKNLQFLTDLKPKTEKFN